MIDLCDEDHVISCLDERRAVRIALGEKCFPRGDLKRVDEHTVIISVRQESINLGSY